MTSIRDVLDRREEGRLLWISETDGPMDGRRLRERSASISTLRADLIGKRVALNIEKDEYYALSLLLLDGVCDAMLLLHPETDAVASEGQIRQFVADFVLTDSALNGHVDERAVIRSHSMALPTNRDTEWFIPTSGTTGTPKLIRHTLRSLTRTVRDSEGRDPLCWGMLYGLSRFAGLQVFLQSLLGGASILFPASRSNVDKALTFFSAQGCDAISATPTMWRKILMSPARERLTLRQITLGGEIVDQSILSALRARYPSARVIHIYASTEAGVGFSVKDGLGGFPRDWLDFGISGIDLKIVDDVLWIRVPGRDLWGHIGSGVEVDGGGFLNTGDCVRIKEDRVLFLGRENGAINVGGNKVLPEEVETILLEHPFVMMANVHGLANPFTGAIVVADVVLSQETGIATGIDRALIEYCRGRLQPYKVPARIRVVESLSVNPTGKITRRNR
jgi:acyl-coenzyme A synthetase/AMP-(fatty) acid ligase